MTQRNAFERRYLGGDEPPTEDPGDAQPSEPESQEQEEDSD